MKECYLVLITAIIASKLAASRSRAGQGTVDPIEGQQSCALMRIVFVPDSFWPIVAVECTASLDPNRIQLYPKNCTSVDLAVIVANLKILHDNSFLFQCSARSEKPRLRKVTCKTICHRKT